MTFSSTKVLLLICLHLLDLQKLYLGCHWCHCNTVAGRIGGQASTLAKTCNLTIEKHRSVFRGFWWYVKIKLTWVVSASLKLIMVHQPPKLQVSCFLHQVVVGSLAVGHQSYLSLWPIPLPRQMLLSQVQLETCWVSQCTASLPPAICASGALCCIPYNGLIYILYVSLSPQHCYFQFSWNFSGGFNLLYSTHRGLWIDINTMCTYKAHFYHHRRMKCL